MDFTQTDRFVGNLQGTRASKPMSSLNGTHSDVAEMAPAQPHEQRELQWLKQAQAGDRAAFGRLVVEYQDRLYNAVLRLIGDRDEARELTQEAFTRALGKLESFRGDASPYTWLFRIAVNLAISQLRKVHRHRVFSLSGPGHNGSHGTDDQASALVNRLAERSAAEPADNLEKREEAEQVVAALGRLDAEYRAVLVMRDVEGFDYQQMADVLGLPLGTLKSRLFRARLALRDELKAYLGRA